MQRGFLGARPGAEPVALLRQQLAEAEAELRQRRLVRLRMEAGRGSTALVAASAAADAAPTLPVWDGAAVAALASHADPPPEPLHRLAEALALALQAQGLGELGDHALPQRVPWKNLQMLLRKSWDPGETVGSTVGHLRQEPFGPRITRHVSERLLGGSTPVTREQVVGADEQCVPAFDFVMALINACSSSKQEGATSPSAGTSTEPKLPVSSLTRESAVEAVSFQELEVARLRRKLKEAERSEAAALDFAAGNAVAATDAVCENRSSAANGNITPGEGCHSEPVYVVSCQTLQYKLTEVTVPPLQEAVLTSMVGLVTEPHAGCNRYLEVVGCAEVREEPSTAAERAEAVRDWLAANGVPCSQLRVKTEPPGGRGSRRVELRLFDSCKADNEVRRRAEELMSRVFPEAPPQAVAEVEIPMAGAGRAVGVAEGVRSCAPATGVARGDPGSGTVPGFTAPGVPVGEVIAEGVPSGGRRSLRVVFKMFGVPPSEAALEARAQAVRLVSCSGAWPAVEVLLPFDVECPATSTARFSRKAGTLTLHLLEAADPVA